MVGINKATLGAKNVMVAGQLKANVHGRNLHNLMSWFGEEVLCDQCCPATSNICRSTILMANRVKFG
uniref:Uncharacterized protein n=1 Tax=Romanomermis culicivorax TaxID=13658 RepID=A0A915JAF6_ROMCU